MAAPRRRWTRTNDDTYEPLPRARLYPAQKLADSCRQPLNNPFWSSRYSHLRDDDPVLDCV